MRARSRARAGAALFSRGKPGRPDHLAFVSWQRPDGGIPASGKNRDGAATRGSRSLEKIDIGHHPNRQSW